MQEESAQDEGPALGELIARVVRGEVLTVHEAEAAFHFVMEGRATAVQIAALLIALRTRGEQPSEVAGGVRALRRTMVPVPADADGLVDTCGTGGGDFGTFNISTAAALLAAGAGVRIAKHGNRSFTSRCGSADVLAAMGVTIELTPEAMGEVLASAGIVFMFAPLLHPAMRHVGPVRRELGVGTVMNVLGPLTNPAGARRQVVGVADPALLPLIAGALRELEHEHALVVHGQPGMDEISPIGPTDVIELKNGTLSRYTVTPEELLGDGGYDADELAGGDPADNARVVHGVLSGELHGAPRAAVILNAAAALYVAEHAESLREGVALAEATLDEGGGLLAFERLREATRRI
ncbi:MAG: anthranilate phosphoribosyltransferase [Longimicrobiales bacterium]